MPRYTLSKCMAIWSLPANPPSSDPPSCPLVGLPVSISNSAGGAPSASRAEPRGASDVSPVRASAGSIPIPKSKRAALASVQPSNLAPFSPFACRKRWVLGARVTQLCDRGPIAAFRPAPKLGCHKGSLLLTCDFEQWCPQCPGSPGTSRMLLRWMSEALGNRGGRSETTSCFHACLGLSHRIQFICPAWRRTACERSAGERRPRSTTAPGAEQSAR